MTAMTDTNLTGAWPIDPDTEVGLFRSDLGDVIGTPHEPSDGSAEYEYIGDAQIAAQLSANPTSRDRALANARQSMATQMIAAAKDIQVDDIRIKTVERAKLMLEQASLFFLGAAGSDVNSSFGVVGLSSHSSYYRPQGTPFSEVG